MVCDSGSRIPIPAPWMAREKIRKGKFIAMPDSADPARNSPSPRM
jgi:hypothetical protein